MKTNLLNAFKDIFKEFLVDFTKFWQKLVKILIVKPIIKINRYRVIYLEHKGIHRSVELGDISIKVPLSSYIGVLEELYVTWYLAELAKQLPTNSTFIDVGAYVGDTIALCIQRNHKINYLAIEPSYSLFEFLKLNKEIFNEKYPKTKILIEQALVGKEVKKAKIEENPLRWPTPSEDESGDFIHSKTLDEIFADSGLDNLRLIKTDIESYDYDAINSGMNIIKKYSPIVYFEYHTFQSHKQLDGYMLMIKKLLNQGYKYWVIIHGNRNFITDTYGSSELFNLLEFQHKHRTVVEHSQHYDVACCKEKDEAILKKALKIFA